MQISTSSVSRYSYKQALAGSRLSGKEAGLCEGPVKSALGMMEVFPFSHFPLL